MMEYLKQTDIVRLIDLIPKMDVSDFSGKYGVQRIISVEMLEHEHEIIVRVWRDMYHSLTMKVAEIQMSMDNYICTKYIPTVNQEIIQFGSVEFRLVAEIIVIQEKTDQIYIPEFIYEPNTDRAIEWRCGHCSVPQKIEERTCCNCGAPRALLIQEMA